MLHLLPRTKRFAFGGASRYSLKTIMDWRDSTWIGTIAMRADRGNADDVGWSDADNSQGGYIGPGEAASFDFGPGQTLAKDFYLSGISEDIVYLTIGLNYTSWIQMQ